MSAPIHLKKAELVLQATYVNENLDVNDYLERYNICKYFEQDLYLSDWSFEEKNHFKNRVEVKATPEFGVLKNRKIK